MIITWFGQSCFRIEGREIRVLVDPFSKEIGLRPPRINDGIVLVTHDHDDHNNAPERSVETFVIHGPGEYERAGVQIVGITSFHDNELGAKRGLNTLYVFKVDGIRLCHLGDIGQQELSDEQITLIGAVDILMIPVGGLYTIDGKTAVAIVKQIEPKIIIPMHYKLPGLKYDLQGPQAFLKELGLKPIEVETLKIQEKSLPQEEMQVYNLTVGA